MTPDANEEMLEAIKALAVMNAKLVAKLYDLHHALAVKVSELSGDSDLLRHIHVAEQMSAAVTDALQGLEKIQKKRKRKK